MAKEFGKRCKTNELMCFRSNNVVDSLSTTIIIEVYMESKSYTTERGCQILISLMKQNNIKKS